MNQELLKWIHFLCSKDRFHNLCISYPLTLPMQQYENINDLFYSKIIEAIATLPSVATKSFLHTDVMHWSNQHNSLNTKDLEVFDEFTYTRAHYLPSKLIIINGPQNLSLSVANKMLKLLEDPPIPLSFILLGFPYNQLLPTVKSRFLNWRISWDALKTSAHFESAKRNNIGILNTDIKTSEDLENWARNNNYSCEDCLNLLWEQFLPHCQQAQKIDRLLSFHQWFEKSKLWNNSEAERWYFLFQMIKNSLNYSTPVKN
jgi:hypothetical protein